MLNGSVFEDYSNAFYEVPFTEETNSMTYIPIMLSNQVSRYIQWGLEYRTRLDFWMVDSVRIMVQTIRKPNIQNGRSKPGRFI